MKIGPLICIIIYLLFPELKLPEMFLFQNNSIKENYCNTPNLSIWYDNDKRLFVRMPSINGVAKLSFFYGGVNRIYGINSIEQISLEPLLLEPNPKEISRNEVTNKKISSKTTSDWIGPYIIKSLSSDFEDTTIEKRFTGGWHGTDGNGTGDSTGKTIKVEVFCDGKIPENNKRLMCNEVIIKVTNEITAYNTTKSALLENVVYTIRNKTVNVRVDSTAMEKINILKYYGLQTENRLYSGLLTYKHYSGEEYSTTSLIESKAFLKKKGKVKELFLRTENKKFQIRGGIICDGLGTFENIPDDAPSCFTAKYGKSYFNLIGGEGVVLNKNDTVFWRGFYQF